MTKTQLQELCTRAAKDFGSWFEIHADTCPSRTWEDGDIADLPEHLVRECDDGRYYELVDEGAAEKWAAENCDCFRALIAELKKAGELEGTR